MSTEPEFRNKTPLGSRRAQIGAAIGVSALAVVAIIGGAAAWVMNDRSNAAADLADKAKLASQLQQPKPAGAPTGQIAVLDPGQIQPATTAPETVSPDMKAMVERDRLDQARMVADQRAVDSRIRSEIMASYRADDAPPPPVVQTRPAPVVTVVQPPQPRLRPIQPPVLMRTRDDDGYRTPEDDSDRYQPRPRYSDEDRGYPPERRYPDYDRPYARDWRDRPPPPPPRRARDYDDDEPD